MTDSIPRDAVIRRLIDTTDELLALLHEDYPAACRLYVVGQDVVAAARPVPERPLADVIPLRQRAQGRR